MLIVSKYCIEKKFLIVAITITEKTKLCIIWVYKPHSKEIDLFFFFYSGMSRANEVKWKNNYGGWSRHWFYEDGFKITPVNL